MMLKPDSRRILTHLPAPPILEHGWIVACASGADATTRHAVSGQLACLRAANGCQLWVRTAITFVATFKGPIGPRTHSMAKDLYELVINATSSLMLAERGNPPPSFE